jgi:hypothetical protein
MFVAAMSVKVFDGERHTGFWSTKVVKKTLIYFLLLNILKQYRYK